MLKGMQLQFGEAVTRAKQRVARLRGEATAERKKLLARLPPPWRRGLTAVFADIKQHDLTGLAAELTYRLFLALFPFLIFLATVSAFVAKATGVENPANSIVDSLGSALPQDTSAFLRRQINDIVGGRSVGLLSFGLLGTLWASAGGINSIIKATNRVWGVREGRPFWKRAVLSVVLTVSAGAGLLLAFVVFVGAQVYGAKVADAIGAGPAFAVTIAILRFPVAVALILLAVAVLYWAAPDNHQPFGWGSIGAVFFTVAWLIATSLFGLYVSHFSSYNKTYGALGGVIVLLVWLNLTSLLLLLGSEINAVVRRERTGELKRAEEGQQRPGGAAEMQGSTTTARAR
jgi:membrane protein